MGILKRVCDDTPRPIREINPDIPDWLAAIIEKLHAKEPGILSVPVHAQVTTDSSMLCD
jgi:hypothetical protein